MAETNPPGWLQNAGATHTAAEMRSYIGAIIGPAVSAGSLVAAGGVSPFLGNKLQVTQTGSPSMNVIVKSGAAWIPGSENGLQGPYGVMNDGDVTLAIAANGSGLARIDGVFFKVQDSQYSGAVNSSSLVVVTGTPSGSPTAPAAPANSIRLANVAVANGAATIVTANITDTRPWMYDRAAPDVQTYTGSTTWTKPDGVRFVTVRVQGSGGAGGGAAAASASQHSVGSGGGAGAYAESTLDATTLAATVAITVGAGGAGVSGAPGNNGNPSSFGSSVVAAGGTGGTTTATSAAAFGVQGSSGGSASAGQIQVKGGDGTAAWGNANFGFGGNGGNAPLGTGGTGRASGSNGQALAGANGGGYGGGGGGALSTSGGAAAAGGNGSGGVVIVVSYY